MNKRSFIMILVFLFSAGFIFSQEAELPETETIEKSDTAEIIEEQNPPVLPASSLPPPARFLEISGELKTGLFWERIEYPLSAIGDECLNCDYPRGTNEICPRTECQSKVNIKNRARIHNSDDAGPMDGRFRFDLHVRNNNLNMGIKVRFQQEIWMASPPPLWDYAYVYGNFFRNQMGLVIGLLGDSPWGAGSIPVPVGVRRLPRSQRRAGRSPLGGL